MRYLLYAVACLALGSGALLTYYYLSFARMIETRLTGERERSLPRVYARPVEVRRGQTISEPEFISRLNDLGYTQRPKVENPGEFAIGRNAVALTPRGGALKGSTLRVVFNPPPAARRGQPPSNRPAAGVSAIEVVGGKSGTVRRDSVVLDTPLLTALMTAGREKRRRVALSSIQPRMREAVLAIEDQLFYSHPGVNPFTTLAAVFTNVFGDKPYLVGGSTITQQLARNFFLTDELAEERLRGKRSFDAYLRKMKEWFMSIVLERRASKDEILELYLNDVYLGQRGSFAIHGVAEASRLFFAKDVSNLGLSEAALIAGVIQSPAVHSPFAHPKRALERRNVVLAAMADEEFITASQAERASREPLQVVARAVDNEAPYFVDHVGELLATSFPGVTAQSGAVEVYTTLDLNLQRIAIDAVRDGLASVDKMLSGRRRKTPPAQAALLAVDPRTGEILAMVGGRSYNQSQYNRAVVSRRQPGSVFKPFVYLSAFERAAEDGRTDVTPASTVADEPTTFYFDDKEWSPENYNDEYEYGPITYREALAHSRNIATIHVGEQAGFDHVADLWRKIGVGTPPQGFPSITLGVFELTPIEVAQAYTIFTNGGALRPLRPLDHIVAGGKEIRPKQEKGKQIARPETTYLVTDMMRAVINNGTAASARANGFALDAAGKTGTTNDLRDAWFVGFTPELLTVVWVGHDDNRPLGLSGSRAALPIWTSFMKHALAGRPNAAFEVPDGINFVEIDPKSGKVASPHCPKTASQAFLTGTEPTQICDVEHDSEANPESQSPNPKEIPRPKEIPTSNTQSAPR